MSSSDDSVFEPAPDTIQMMRLSVDSVIEPIPEAIRRTAEDEVEDLDNACDNAVNEAYLNWPNEAGFENLVEHRGPIVLELQGDIPWWVRGSLFRTGPGINKIEDTPTGTIQLSHWFDGLAQTHRFDIVTGVHDNRKLILYSSRRQCDDFVKHVQSKGLGDMITFAQKSDPCVGMFGKIASSWSAAKPDRATQRLENAGVTVQLGVPGLPSALRDVDRIDAETVWLGTDAGFLREIHPRTLEPIGFAKQERLHPDLKGPLSCAHPQRCPETGDYFNINISGGPKATYKVFRVSAATGKTEVLAQFSFHDLPMAYIHSFYLSEHFVIVRVPSSHISAHGLSILWKKNLLEAMEPFDKSKSCQWFVIDRHHGKGLVAKFKTEAAFFFHTVNCFEEPLGQIHGPKVTVTMDTIEYPNMDILNALRYEVLLNRDEKAKAAWGTKEKARPMLPYFVRRKIVIPLPQDHESSISLTSFVRLKYDYLKWRVLSGADGVARRIRGLSPQKLSWLRIRHQRPVSQNPASLVANPINIPAPHIGELPTINPEYHTRHYRYVYSLAMGCQSTLVDTIIKTDLATREVLRWNNPIGHTPSEAVFVGNPDGSGEEDDGVLLSVVLDGQAGTSYLLCLNAKTMKEMARADMDFAVGFGFHGVHTRSFG